MSNTLPRFFFLLFFCLTVLPLGAQSFKAYVKAGEDALQRKDYNAALQYFGNALEFKPDDPDVAYQYAEVARRFYAFEIAETYYQKVLESPKREQYPLAAFWLATVYKSLGQYDKAKAHFRMYLAQKNTAAPFREQASDAISACDWAREMAAEPARIQVEHLDKKVNTDYSEFAPLVQGDTLYYSSFRYEKQKDDYKPTRMVSKVLYQRGGSRGRTLSRGFNDDNLHTANLAFSLDGSRLYFTRCDYVNASEIRCAIYYRNQDKRGRWSARAIRLPEEINQVGYTATQPCIGYDSILQAELLFFVSDSPGGPGGLDIWWSRVEEGENKFSRPSRLQELNTPMDDITPYFHNPSQTLYFSSEGYTGLGGFDVFRSRRGQAWSTPENLGAPINSSYNDIYYTLENDGESGYLSSNRPGSFYLDEANKACCNDIYHFEPIPEEPPQPETPALTETPPTKTPPSTEEPSVPTKLEDFLPLALYFDNDEPDRRTRRETTKKTYLETYEKYYARQGEYLQEFTKPLSEENKVEGEVAIETFFEDNVRKGYEYLLLFSEILLKRLQSGEQVEIFLKGYTSPRAKSDYNLALSQRRISSVRNHFQSYKDGVFKPYLENNRLKISERPFGEAEAARTVSDALDDQRNSIYHPDAARERRVEIVEAQTVLSNSSSED
ncbi:MAG: hypothetical protein KDD02_20180 [Phaeodactylibacter sp.]|nr:hypothetical protein [Phaeodactylibacter sp.]